MALKFACLARVSTEAQEKKGESLDTQEKQLQNAVRSAGGILWKLYRGQEHATSGQDRTLLDQLLNDAKDHLFDAVMVTDVSRWSRDNRRSKDDLSLLRKNGIKFFVLNQEFDLFDHNHNFMLGIHGEIAEYYANTQAYKAMINKIERAKKGYPSSCGASKVPFGRTFNKKSGEWGIDLEKQALMQEIVRLIIEEDWTCMKAATHFGIRVATLNKQLKQLGSVWIQHFNSERLNIHEDVKTEIPALVPDDVAEKVRLKLATYRTNNRGPQKYFYLFNRKVLDRASGESLTGKTTISRGKKYSYYRPWHGGKSGDYHIPCQVLEEAVLSELFAALSGKIQIKAAVFGDKNSDEIISELHKRRDSLVDELYVVNRKLSNFRVAIGRYTGENFSSFIEGLSRDIEKAEVTKSEIQKKISMVNQQISAIPTDEEIEMMRKSVLEMISDRATAKDDKSSTLRRKHLADSIKGAATESWLSSGCAFKELPDIEKKKIINLLFGGKDAVGRRYGIYVECLDKAKRRYRYEAYGRFTRLIGVIDGSQYDGTNLDDYAPPHPPIDEEQSVLSKVGEIVRRQHPGLKGRKSISTTDPRS